MKIMAFSKIMAIAVIGLLFIIQPLFVLRPALADVTGEIRQDLEERIVIVIDILKKKGLDKETRNKEIIATLEPIIDFPLMARLSLGKKYSRLSKEQKIQYSRLFVKKLQDSYVDKLDSYTDERVDVQEAKQVKKRVVVVLYLISKGEKFEMQYKYYQSKKGWKIYDIEILGVSIVQTYRSQFEGFLKNRSLEELLAKLSTSGEFTITDPQKK